MLYHEILLQEVIDHLYIAYNLLNLIDQEKASFFYPLSIIYELNFKAIFYLLCFFYCTIAIRKIKIFFL